VANPRRPLRLNVGFLISSPIGTSHDFNFDYEKMRLGEDLLVREFSGTARFDHTPQGLILQGSFSAQTDLDCVRCLEGFVHTLKWTVTELYAFDERSLSESELLVPEDKHIDLEPILREYALLEFPISPICKPECKGLCQVCGENLNLKDCGHRPESDSPFSVLKDLLK
jgi:uncharacterized protein